MAELSWQKPASVPQVAAGAKRLRFLAAGFILLAAVGILIFSGTLSGSRYFITINELLTKPELSGKTVKMTGAVIGSTIKFDADTKTIHFTVAHITDNSKELETEGGLAKALHLAVLNPNAKRVEVVVRNQPMPDLLRDEAQAIVTGKLNAQGVFEADELLLKCPSKYSADVPQQVQSK